MAIQFFEYLSDAVERGVDVDGVNRAKAEQQSLARGRLAVEPVDRVQADIDPARQPAQQGQVDPTDALMKMGKLIEEREKGTSVHDAVLKVFKPKEQAAPAATDPLAALMGGGGQPGPGGAPAPGGSTAPGGAGQPQGMDIMSLLSGLTGKGEAQMSTSTRRQSGI